MEFLTIEWFLQNACQAIYSGVVWIAVGIPFAWIFYQYWLHNKEPDPLAVFLYVYFVPEAGGYRLVLSTQLTEKLNSILEPGACRLWKKYYFQAKPGEVLALAKAHRSLLLGHLANYFWTHACGAGQLARSLGLPVQNAWVNIFLVRTPENGSGRARITPKYRVLIVADRVFDELPENSQVLDLTSKEQEWLCVLRAARDLRNRQRAEHGQYGMPAFVWNELVIRG